MSQVPHQIPNTTVNIWTSWWTTWRISKGMCWKIWWEAFKDFESIIIDSLKYWRLIKTCLKHLELASLIHSYFATFENKKMDYNNCDNQSVCNVNKNKSLHSLKYLL